MKRIYQLMPFIVLIAMLFAGCGSPAATTAPAASPSPAATTAAPASTPPAGTDAPTAAPTDEPAATPGEAPQEALDVGFGAIASLNGAAMQVTKVETFAGDDVDQPASGKEYVIVTVAVKNAGADILNYSPYYFKLRNSAGQEDDATILQNSSTALDTGELLPGGMISGTVAFEEPKGETKLAFIYEDAVLSEEKRITIDLSDTGATVQSMTQGEIKAADIPTVNPGEENKLGDATVTLNKVTKSSGDEYTAPKAGMEYVLVEVTVKNTGAETLSCGPFDFKMRNSLGWQSGFTQVSFLDNELESVDLAPGTSVTGTVAFEEPAGDAGLVLVYQQLSLEKTDYVGFAVK